MDFAISLYRALETIAIAIEFAKAFGSKDDKDIINFDFRWVGLKGRMLTSWASHQNQPMFGSQEAYRNTVSSNVEVPVAAAKDTYHLYVFKVLEPLYQIFDYKIDIKVVEELARKFLRRESLGS
jgi:predicted nucleotidyltransferase